MKQRLSYSHIHRSHECSVPKLNIHSIPKCIDNTFLIMLNNPFFYLMWRFFFCATIATLNMFFLRHGLFHSHSMWRYCTLHHWQQSEKLCEIYVCGFRNEQNLWSNDFHKMVQSNWFIKVYRNGCALAVWITFTFPHWTMSHFLVTVWKTLWAYGFRNEQDLWTNYFHKKILINVSKWLCASSLNHIPSLNYESLFGYLIEINREPVLCIFSGYWVRKTSRVIKDWYSKHYSQLMMVQTLHFLQQFYWWQFSIWGSTVRLFDSEAIHKV